MRGLFIWGRESRKAFVADSSRLRCSGGDRRPGGKAATLLAVLNEASLPKPNA